MYFKDLGLERLRINWNTLFLIEQRGKSDIYYVHILILVWYPLL